jgi:hypothetical protein
MEILSFHTLIPGLSAVASLIFRGSRHRPGKAIHSAQNVGEAGNTGGKAQQNADKHNPLIQPKPGAEARGSKNTQHQRDAERETGLSNKAQSAQRPEIEMVFPLITHTAPPKKQSCPLIPLSISITELQKRYKTFMDKNRKI